ncbi:hypothetical protein [Nocardia nova]|uniref:hypothetical protein n=1 Tax=Nocardia nova TaxID=37330 RepID=UPI0033DF1D0B
MNDVRRQVSERARPRPSSPESAPPLTGRLIAESPATISVRVAEGIWTLDRADVLRLRTEPGADPGEPAVLVWIRPGATADFTQRRRIQLTERPLTLASRPSPAVGDDLLALLTDRWVRQLRLRPATGAAGATVSYSQTRSGGGSDDGTACDSLD